MPLLFEVFPDCHALFAPQEPGPWWSPFKEQFVFQLPTIFRVFQWFYIFPRHLIVRLFFPLLRFFPFFRSFDRPKYPFSPFLDGRISKPPGSVGVLPNPMALWWLVFSQTPTFFQMFNSFIRTNRHLLSLSYPNHQFCFLVLKNLQSPQEPTSWWSPYKHHLFFLKTSSLP